MTIPELNRFLNDNYGLTRDWPETLEVDHETYANVVHHYLTNDFQPDSFRFKRTLYIQDITTGPNGGPMFKNVELILKEK